MSNKQKTYFLCPGWDFPVDSVRLGAILSDLNLPHKSISRADDENLIDTPIYPSHKYNFSDKLEKSKSHKYGMFAQFLRIFGLGGEASVAFEKGSIETYAFKHMKTEWFLPSESFAKASSEIPRVASFFDRTDFEKPVYIITGLKVVEGASVTTNPKKSRLLNGKLGFDGTPSGVPWPWERSSWWGAAFESAILQILVEGFDCAVEGLNWSPESRVVRRRIWLLPTGPKDALPTPVLHVPLPFLSHTTSSATFTFIYVSRTYV